MVQYARKTCNVCGVRDIQPNMVRQTVVRNVGSSKQSISGGTVLGAAFGNQASHKQIQKTLFANNKRSYKRNYQVWMCKDCAEEAKKHLSDSDSEISDAVMYGIVIFVLFVIVSFF